MKKLLLSLMALTIQPSRLADAVLAIPRILCGYFLAYNFGGSKFGLPWSPGDNNLDLFQVAAWFPKDVAAFGGVVAVAPVFFAWMATYVKRYKLATIVGQPTGGNQLGFSGGYIFFHRLPHTRAEIDIPVFGINPFPVTKNTPDGGIQPDILV